MWQVGCMKAIQITFEEDLLNDLDADDKVKAIGRSALLRQLAREYLRRERERRIDEQYAGPTATTAVRIPSGRSWERTVTGRPSHPRATRGPEVVRRIRRGDVRSYPGDAGDGGRLVVVLARNGAMPFLRGIMVAQVTTVIRGLPSEVTLGKDFGLEARAAVNLGRRDDRFAEDRRS